MPASRTATILPDNATPVARAFGVSWQPSHVRSRNIGQEPDLNDTGPVVTARIAGDSGYLTTQSVVLN